MASIGEARFSKEGTFRQPQLRIAALMARDLAREYKVQCIRRRPHLDNVFALRIVESLERRDQL